MDDENQVTAHDDTHASVRLFLGDELQPLQRKAEPAYDLAAEYAKTRAHRNRRVWLLLAACFAGVALMSASVTLAVSVANERLAININTFDDLNLRSLLSSVGRTKMLQEVAEKRRAALEAALEAALRQTAQKRENDLFTLRSMTKVLPAARIEERRKAVEQEYEESLLKLHEAFDGQIQVAESEVRQYAEQLATYDRDRLSQAESSAFDSQKQLHDLEMQAQASRYEKELAELRELMTQQQAQAAQAQRNAVEAVRTAYQARIDELDPYVRNSYGSSLVQASKADALPALEGAPRTHDSLSEAMQASEKDFADFDYLTAIVADVPQERDIPSYVQAMKTTAHKIGSELMALAKALQQKADGLESTLSRYESACSALSAERGADGIVLSAGEKGVLPLYVTAAAQARIAAGSTKAEIRSGAQRIAEVSIQRRDGGYVGVLSQPEQAALIKPFMDVRLQVQSTPQ